MQAQGRRTPPDQPPASSSVAPGSSYRFLVRSAEEAVGAIRSQLGEEARVVSVRSVKAAGLTGLLGGTRLEVIAQTPTSRTAEMPSPASPAASIDASSPSPALAASGAAVAHGETDSGAAPVGLSAIAAPVAPAAVASVAKPAATHAVARHYAAAQPKIETLLRRSGISEPMIARLQGTPDWDAIRGRPLHEGLSEVARKIREFAGAPVVRPLAPRAAFVGMPGVGRTTALCKWLAAEVFIRGRRGRVASIEFDRPQSSEDLAVFAELLGIEFSRVAAPVTGNAAGFTYLDVPAISLTRPDENHRLREWLDQNAVAGRVLVLSSLCEAGLLRHACTVGLEMGCTHVVFTHLDELPQWGKLWDFLVEAPLAPLLLSTGPSLTGECETDVVNAVLRRTFPWN